MNYSFVTIPNTVAGPSEIAGFIVSPQKKPKLPAMKIPDKP